MYLSLNAPLIFYGSGGFMMYSLTSVSDLLSRDFEFPRDFEILGWCPVGPVLRHGEKVPL